MKILEDENYKNNEDENIIEDKGYGGFFRKIFFIIILLCILIIIYARYIGTTGLIIKEYTIKNEELPKSFHGLKIAHFSDIHYGKSINLEYLKNLVEQINLTKPDIVVFTGDFIDKSIKISDKEMSNIIEILLQINSVYGNYYITGDHDTNFIKYEEMLNNSNFSNLNDKHEIILNNDGESIMISGIDYKSNMKYIKDLFKNELPRFKINIMHTPDTYDYISNYKYDLILAGHSHNGQIVIPFYGPIYTPNGAKKYYREYYKLNTTDMYISSGIGTTKYNYRLFNRPSFNLYRLTKK